MQQQRHWEIFCAVIDNHGDLGVCWRLACQLAEAGQQVRLWVDDASALAWMAPSGHAGVSCIDGRDPAAWQAALAAPAPDVLIEAFGCDPAPERLARLAEAVAADGRTRPWINLEYLSAEPAVERLHGLASPVFQGPGAGLQKHFFYPGFTARTGGLLREPDLAMRQAAFDRRAWLASQGIAWQGERIVSLFCYEPPALGALLRQLAAGPAPTRLLVTPGRAAAAVQACLTADAATAQTLADSRCALTLHCLPYLTQTDFDHLLWAADLNLVRGEDSLVRAIWAGAPMLWQIYPQDDGVHADKLAAFLDQLQAPASLRQAHAAWNGLAQGAALPLLDAPLLADWRAVGQAARTRWQAADGLVAQLQRFIEQKR